MAKPKTFRLRPDQAEWLAEAREVTGLRSENQVMEFVIDHMMKIGWPQSVRVDAGGWISGPSQDVPS